MNFADYINYCSFKNIPYFLPLSCPWQSDYREDRPKSTTYVPKKFRWDDMEPQVLFLLAVHINLISQALWKQVMMAGGFFFVIAAKTDEVGLFTIKNLRQHLP